MSNPIVDAYAAEPVEDRILWRDFFMRGYALGEEAPVKMPDSVLDAWIAASGAQQNEFRVTVMFSRPVRP